MCNVAVIEFFIENVEKEEVPEYPLNPPNKIFNLITRYSPLNKFPNNLTLINIS